MGQKSQTNTSNHCEFQVNKLSPKKKISSFCDFLSGFSVSSFQILTDIAVWTRMQERQCKTSIRNSKKSFEEDCFSSTNSELYIGFV